MDITPHRHRLQLGDPLVLTVEYRIDESEIDEPGTGPATIQHSMRLRVQSPDAAFDVAKFLLVGAPLLPQDDSALAYAGRFLLLYHAGDQRLLFAIPGTYALTVSGGGMSSASVKVVVDAPSEQQKSALALLSDPADWRYIQYGQHPDTDKYEQTVDRLQQVVARCPQTPLALLCAGRLGIDFFERFHKEHKSFEGFKVKLRDGFHEPLFEDARRYLAKGAALSEEFPIRENVLYALSVTEYINDDFERAQTLLDELGEKYPRGKYGARALEGKAELDRLKERESGGRTSTARPTQSLLLALVVAVVLAVAAGIAFVWARSQRPVHKK